MRSLGNKCKQGREDVSQDRVRSWGEKEVLPKKTKNQQQTRKYPGSQIKKKSFKERAITYLSDVADTTIKMKTEI